MDPSPKSWKNSMPTIIGAWKFKLQANLRQTHIFEIGGEGFALNQLILFGARGV